MATKNAEVETSTGSDPFEVDEDYSDTTEDTRHSREDSVESKTFELLVQSTYQMDEYYGLQCRFILFLSGRLGLRAGEIAHMKEDWIDWRRSMIEIPLHQTCEKGKDGGICGMCKQNARQKSDGRTEKRYERVHDDLEAGDELEPGGGLAQKAVLNEEEFYQGGWTAKTQNAAREIPFDSVVRAGIVVDRFFEKFDEWPLSQTAINRRVDRMAEMTEGIQDDALYPHALRSSAATFWADHGLNAHSLKGLMGWAQLSTSRVYISESSQRTAQAMRDATI
jgi:integrase